MFGLFRKLSNFYYSDDDSIANSFYPVIKFLWLCGLWPKTTTNNQTLNKRIYNPYQIYSFLTILILNIIITGTQFIYLCMHLQSIEELSASVLFAELLLVTYKQYRIYNYNDRIRNMLDDLSQMQQQYILQGQPTSKQKSFLKATRQQFFRLCYIFYINIYLSIVCFQWFKPTDRNVLPFRAWFPFDYSVYPIYELICLYQSLSHFYVGMVTANADLLVVGLMMHIGAQCDCLCVNLEAVDVDANKSMALIACIEHYQAIKKYDF